jgi:DNA polymerase III epsilon subunit-like protein
MAINGITQDIIDAEGRPPEECFREVIPFFNMNIPNLTHNGIRFDIPFLLAQCEKVLDWDEATALMYKNKIEKNALDTAVFVKAGKLGLARDWNETFHDFGKRVMSIMAKGVKYNVGLCCDELEIDRSDVTLHRAGGDCNLTHQIYQKLIA